MAGGFANFLVHELLDHALNGDAWNLPTAGTVWVSLFTVAPTDTGGGTEVTGGSYARVAVDSSSANKWVAPASRATDNNAAITFPTASASWGTAVAFGIHDAVSAGNMMIWADLTTNRTIGNGETGEFAIGDLDISAAAS
jgi:hypothetical protein